MLDSDFELLEFLNDLVNLIDSYCLYLDSKSYIFYLKEIQKDIIISFNLIFENYLKKVGVDYA